MYLKVTKSGLLEGMNVQGFIQSNAIRDVIPVPRKLLLENDHIYVVHNDSLKKEKIKVAHIENNTMYVTGINEGTMVLNRSVLGAYEGMPVQIIQ